MTVTLLVGRVRIVACWAIRGSDQRHGGGPLPRRARLGRSRDTGGVSAPTADPAGDPTGTTDPAVEPAPDTVVYGGERFQAAPTRRHGRQTVRDMVISMAVIGAVIAALMLVTWRPRPEAGPREVDWAEYAQTVQTRVEYPVAMPAGLSDAWISTSVRFERTDSSSGRPVWHIGFVTPASQYAGVEQTDGDSAAFVAGLVGGAKPEGTVSLAGRDWQRYGSGANGYRTLVLIGQPSTIAITGSASDAELEQLAASLKVAG